MSGYMDRGYREHRVDGGRAGRRAVHFFRAGRRHLEWISGKYRFAKSRLSDSLLPCLHAFHTVDLERSIGTYETRESRAANVRLAAARLDGVLLRPGETLSFWKCLGRPDGENGYRATDLAEGTGADMSGGLRPISDLLFWMTLHTPLTVDERYRHSGDLFADGGGAQPFGSGAACIYPHRDLVITNDTAHTFQLRLCVENGQLRGQWRCDHDPYIRYRVVERDHCIRVSSTGGYSRRNRLYRQGVNPDGEVLFEELAVENHALMEIESAPGAQLA